MGSMKNITDIQKFQVFSQFQSVDVTEAGDVKKELILCRSRLVSPDTLSV